MTNELTTRIPFAFARSALFRPAEHRGETFNCTEIPAATDYEISLHYSGPELTPCHATAWQAVIAIAFDRNKGTAKPLTVKLIDILRAMGRTSIQTHAKRWLRSLLNDLAKAKVAFTSRLHSFNGLLLALIEDAGNGTVRVDFPAGMDDVLSIEAVSIPLASKAGLTSFALASWLHDYIATHHNVYQISLKRLHALCGSTLTHAMFRRRLRSALDAVVKQPNGQSRHSLVLARYTLMSDAVTFHKRPTKVLMPKKDAPARAPAWHERACQEARNQRVSGYL